MQTQSSEIVQMPINLIFDSNSLKSLIKEGKLHASDFHCCDKQSKTVVWEMMRTITAEVV